MATTTSSFNTLTIPAPDDTMDTSSPAHPPRDDDDIEIDFDDYQPGPITFTDDDQMVEDTTRPTTATDEVMGDDVQQASEVAPEAEHEEVMHDDVGDSTVTEYDEELIDYGDEDEGFQDDMGHHNDTLNRTDPLFPNSDAAGDADVQHVDGETEEADTTITAPGVSAGSPIQDANPAEPSFAGGEKGEEEEEEVEEVDVAAEHDFESYFEPDGTAPVDEESFVDDYAEPDEEHTAESTGEHERQPLAVDTTRTSSTEGPDTPTDTGLHPMTVRYRDMQFPLFKSKRQLGGLLNSDNLASLSLSSLAQDCRRQLSKRDQSVSDDQDIILNFDQLGLVLVEDCHAAFETSLHDVLEVYLHLHHNEGWEDIAPLSLTISTQLKFTSSFTFLKNAADLGQGISQFSFMQSRRDDEVHHLYLEGDGELDENALHEDDHYADDEEYHETAQLEHDDAARDYNQDLHEEDPDHQQNLHEEDPDHQQNREEFHDETGQKEYHTDAQGEAADDLDGLAGEQEDATYHAADEISAVEDQGTVIENGLAGDKAASTASSTTIQGDKDTASNTVDNSTVGKYYDDDLIDWDDDDCLTSDTSENTTSEPEDRTLDTEYEATGETKVDGTDDQQHLASDDWLNEVSDDQIHGLPHEETAEQQYYEDQEIYAEDKEEGEADGINADLYKDGYQGDEGFLNPDYQPVAGEEDEQFHTAHEGIFDGQEYEHGLERTEHQEDAQQEGGKEPVEGEEEEESDDTVIIHPQPEVDDEEEYYEEEGREEQHDINEFEDEINFDEDDEQQHQQPPPLKTTAAESVVRTSPRGKRSFEEVDDLDDDDDATALELPEVKKIRSS